MTKSVTREELEKQHDECMDGIHKWQEEKAIVCEVCGIYQNEFDNRKKVAKCSHRYKLSIYCSECCETIESLELKDLADGVMQMETKMECEK